MSAPDVSERERALKATHHPLMPPHVIQVPHEGMCRGGGVK